MKDSARLLFLIPMMVATYSGAVDVADHMVTVHHSTIRLSVPPKLVMVRASGICIDQSCSVIATAYHTQLMAGRGKLGISGARTEKVLSLANENETDKTVIRVGDKMESYSLAQDISFIYTKKPVPRRSGAPHSYECSVGQKVYVVGSFKRKQVKTPARILGVNVPLLVNKKGELRENLVLDVAVPLGTSGGAVFDRQGNLLGMVVVTGTVRLGNQDAPASVALPLRAIAGALLRLDPGTAAQIFSDMPNAGPPKPVETAAVVYQEELTPDDAATVIPEFAAVATVVPDAVERLHARSREAANRMQNLIAKECLTQGRQKPLCHEVSIADGEQRFRKVGKNGELGEAMASFPRQKRGYWGSSEWLDDLREAAAAPWKFEGAAGEGYLFSLRSRAQDERCQFSEYPINVPLFGRHRDDWQGSVDCIQTVLTDRDFNPIVLFTEYTPPGSCLTELLQTALYFEWVQLKDLPSPILLPARERMSAKVEDMNSLVYSQISWIDYRRFGAEHRINLTATGYEHMVNDAPASQGK